MSMNRSNQCNVDRDSGSKSSKSSSSVKSVSVKQEHSYLSISSSSLESDQPIKQERSTVRKTVKFQFTTEDNRIIKGKSKVSEPSTACPQSEKMNAFSHEKVKFQGKSNVTETDVSNKSKKPKLKGDTVFSQDLHNISENDVDPDYLAYLQTVCNQKLPEKTHCHYYTKNEVKRHKTKLNRSKANLYQQMVEDDVVNVSEENVTGFIRKLETRFRLPKYIVSAAKNTDGNKFVRVRYNESTWKTMKIVKTKASDNMYVLEHWIEFMKKYGLAVNDECYVEFDKSNLSLQVNQPFNSLNKLRMDVHEVVSSDEDNVTGFMRKVETRFRVPKYIVNAAKKTQTKTTVRVRYNKKPWKMLRIIKTKGEDRRYVLDGWSEFIKEVDLAVGDECYLKFNKANLSLQINKSDNAFK